MSLEFQRSDFPWLPGDHTTAVGLGEHVASFLPTYARRLLPDSISIVFPSQMSERYLRYFVAAMTAQLRRDVSIWNERLSALDKLGPRFADEAFFHADALRKFQPWILLISEEGGLDWTIPAKSAGVVTCSTRSNHGVAWWKASDGCLCNVLITARAPDRDWDWDSDIGHEATHAAIAPIPIFTQNIERAARRSFLSRCAEEVPLNLSKAQMSRIFYMASELVVTSIRSEQRFTSTGLPEFVDVNELRSFFSILNTFAPDLGFSDVQGMFYDGSIFYPGSNFLIGPVILPLLRFLSKTQQFLGQSEPPTVSEIIAHFESECV